MSELLMKLLEYEEIIDIDKDYLLDKLEVWLDNNLIDEDEYDILNNEILLLEDI